MNCIRLSKIKCLMVGVGGIEPPTSRLSGVRSNRLSYRPRKAGTARLRGRPDGASERGREVKAAATGCRRRVTEPPGVRPAETIVTLVFRRSGSRSVRRRIRRCGTIQKGGDPAAGSPTATLLRLSSNRQLQLRRFPPCGWDHDFSCIRLS